MLATIAVIVIVITLMWPEHSKKLMVLLHLQVLRLIFLRIKHMSVTASNTVFVIDLKTNSVIHRIKVGTQ